jgi:hypothetical protein
MHEPRLEFSRNIFMFRDVSQRRKEKQTAKAEAPLRRRCSAHDPLVERLAIDVLVSMVHQARSKPVSDPICHMMSDTCSRCCALFVISLSLSADCHRQTRSDQVEIGLYIWSCLIIRFVFPTGP